MGVSGCDGLWFEEGDHWRSEGIEHHGRTFVREGPCARDGPRFFMGASHPSAIFHVAETDAGGAQGALPVRHVGKQKPGNFRGGQMLALRQQEHGRHGHVWLHAVLALRAIDAQEKFGFGHGRWRNGTYGNYGTYRTYPATRGCAGTSDLRRRFAGRLLVATSSAVWAAPKDDRL